jgi:hypothetical protein
METRYEFVNRYNAERRRLETAFVDTWPANGFHGARRAAMCLSAEMFVPQRREVVFGDDVATGDATYAGVVAADGVPSSVHPQGDGEDALVRTASKSDIVDFANHFIAGLDLYHWTLDAYAREWSSLQSAPRAFVVTGAGRREANGVYTRAGT